MTTFTSFDVHAFTFTEYFTVPSSPLGSEAVATGSFNDGVGGSILHITLNETAAATSTPTILILLPAVVSSGNATSAVSYKQHVVVTDHVNAAALFSGSGKMLNTVLETAAAFSGAGIKLGAALDSTADASATSPMRLTAVLREAADSTAAEITNRFVTATLNSNAAAVDADSQAALETGDETADVTETVIGIRRVIVQIEDSAGDALATDASSNHAIMALHEAAVAAATGTYHLLATQFVESTADASEFIRLPAASTPNFWSNTRSGAAASWSGLPFNSMVFADGKFYGAGEDGLFVLVDGIDDPSNVTVNSQVVWDLDNFGSPQRKRLKGVYTDAATHGPFTVRVTNEQGSFDYVTAAPRTASPVNYRVVPGKGLRSAYYRIGISSAADFSAGQSTVEYEDLGRRI